MKTKISVVIPCYNAEQTILKCLNALKAQSYDAYEVILVENGSKDSTFSIINDFIKKNRLENFHLYQIKAKETCRARNFGIRKAKGEIIVNMDPDCLPCNDHLQEIADSYSSKEIGGVAGNIIGYNPSNSMEKFLALYTLRGLPESSVFSEFNLIAGGFATANLSFRKKIWQEIGGFDEKLPHGDYGAYGEDHDICARIYQAGYKIKYNIKAVVYHIHRKNFFPMLKKGFVFGIGHAFMLKKHFRNYTLIQLPRKDLIFRKIKWRCWIELNYADKKMFFLILPSIFSNYLLLLPLLYFLWLIRKVSRRAKRDKIALTKADKILLPFYLLMKSFFMTLGRVYGSVKFKVICI